MWECMTQCYEGVLLQSSIVFLLLLLNVSHILLVRRKLDRKENQWGNLKESPRKEIEVIQACDAKR